MGTVAQARIRRSVFSCRPHCHSCRWSSHSLLSWRMLWYRHHVFVLIYLILFITDCFIRKWCSKRILIPSTFVGSFCLSNWFLYLLVGLLSGCLVGCLVICFLWLVGRSVFIGWLVLVHSHVWCWLTARLTALRSFHSLVSQNTSPELITKAGSPGVSGHRKFETLLIV